MDQYESHRDVSRGPRVCGGDQVVCGDNHWSHQFVPLTLSTAHQSAAAQGGGCSWVLNSDQLHSWERRSAAYMLLPYKIYLQAFPKILTDIVHHQTERDSLREEYVDMDLD